MERHPDAVDATVEGETVVMNIHTLDYYRFNPVASRIWELLADGAMSEEALLGALLDEYDVTEDECRTSVDTFVSDAMERGFLRTHSPS